MITCENGDLSLAFACVCLLTPAFVSALENCITCSCIVDAPSILGSFSVACRAAPTGIGEFQAVSNRRFVNRRFSQLNDERCWHIRERSPSRCCNLPVSEALYFVGNSAKWAVTSGWRALTDMPTSLVIQLRKPPVNKPPVRHSLRIPIVAVPFSENSTLTAVIVL